MWSVRVANVEADIMVAVMYAITMTPTNIQMTPRTRAKKNLGALSPYLRTEITLTGNKNFNRHFTPAQYLKEEVCWNCSAFNLIHKL